MSPNISIFPPALPDHVTRPLPRAAGFVFLVPWFPFWFQFANRGANQMHQRGIGHPGSRGVKHKVLWCAFR